MSVIAGAWSSGVEIGRCWREGLLARAVLGAATRGYRRHPQLARFRTHPRPIACIDTYLRAICDEAERRGCRFDRSKLGRSRVKGRLPVTRGQLEFEWEHLASKLKRRRVTPRFPDDTGHAPSAPPLFKTVREPIAEWERGRRS
ncbi:MAG: hypothetical protein HYU53_15160 [Acidobacteria bacterium]|nr:hypothetical protein [Acidobacteriota bacterium]